MKILALTKYFPPEIGTASHLFYELCESLVNRNHEVTVVTGFPWYNVEEPDEKYKGKLFLREKMNGIQVIRIAEIPLPQGVIRYKAGHFLVPPVLFFAGLVSNQQDIIIVYSPPLFMGLSAYLLAKIKGASFIFNVQDLHPQCLIDLGQLKNQVLIRFLEAVEKFIYRKASYVTVHSEGNREHIIFKEADPEKVIVIPNWVDTEMIKPAEKFNDFRVENNLGKKFVVSFAGTMGISQGLEVVIESANVLKSYENILFLLVGNGVDRENLEMKAKNLRLNNVKFLPMQPREKYPHILSASDVCLVTLKKEVITPVVPSKILSIMASGRPVVASLNLNGDAPQIIEDAQCGYCVEPGNPEALAEAVLKLYNDKSLREEFGKNGRIYAEKHFSITACVEKYEQLFLRIGRDTFHEF